MAGVLNYIHKIENHFDTEVERCADSYPFIYMVAMLILVPIFILSTVLICTILIVIPFSLLCGWI